MKSAEIAFDGFLWDEPQKREDFSRRDTEKGTKRNSRRAYVFGYLMAK